MDNDGDPRDHDRGATDGTGGRRGQAERDAVTVEIGYALASAAFVAAVAFGVVAGPALFLDLSRDTVRMLVTAGGGLAAAVFALRVATVLFRFNGGNPAAQPSQPGRTRPDS
ncbi:DUF6332 family protein [Streptomyces sp. NBC_01558]|uniref:DUF6332 family protein n=1 Tax=Streptomyces sp. NBC_01558 TaxID=2975878 RepID=UPI002DDB21E5|nr:DUF6332 family protein [Streptomyces sp. NBC_01558]WSD81349.1 DUF6332 family protein [Streptomyces sp. NBC_01558]